MAAEDRRIYHSEAAAAEKVMQVLNMAHRANARSYPMLTVTLLLALGLVLSWLFREAMAMTNDAIAMALLVVPPLLYLAMVGRLNNVKGLGFEVKLGQPVMDSSARPAQSVSVTEARVIPKVDLESLEAAARGLSDTQPIVMTMLLGNRAYEPPAVREHLKMLSMFRNFKLIVFLSTPARVVGFMPPAVAQELLNSTTFDSAFVDAVRSERRQDLVRLGMIERTVTGRDTNADVLREMTARNMEALVVVNDDGTLRGVVERLQVLSTLILGLAPA
jgi:CBS domain-containing protein